MSSEIFYQCAITCPVAREKLLGQVRELFEEEGFEESPEVYDPTGEYVLARVVGSEDENSCVQIFEQGSSCVDVARSLSLLLGEKVVFHEVTVKDEPDAKAEDWAAVMVVAIWPDGSAMDVPPELHLEQPISGLDRYKASRKLLRALVDPRIVEHPSAKKPLELWLYREAPDDEEEDEIEPRLRALVDDIGIANNVTMTDIGGRPALRMELPDGTTRMSVVSASDLEVINQMTGLGLTRS